MRGEYKVPGGKLVAVDVEAEDGRITSAAVSGDFFLEPDEALEDIDGAIVGLSATSSSDQIAQAITQVAGTVQDVNEMARNLNQMAEDLTKDQG